MANKQHRDWAEMKNLFSDPKFSRQAWKSVGIAIAMQPAVKPIQTFDKDGNETHFEIHTDKQTVGQALLDCQLIEGEEGQYGLYVKTVNGITADYDVDATYWAFYVNGEYAMTGVDITDINVADHYMFKVEK